MEQLFGPRAGATPVPEHLYDDLTFPARGPAARRPYVVLNMVATVDGKATLGQGADPRPIGSPVDRTLMARLRHHAGAVMRGAGTVRQAPYYPKGAPLAVVVSGSGKLPLDSGFFRDAPQPPVIIVGPAVAPATRAALGRAGRVHLSPGGPGGGAVDLRWALELLAQTYGVQVLVCEGGPRLNQGLLAAGAVDELFLTLAPRIAGGGEDVTIVEGTGLLEPMPQLQLISLAYHADELFLRYRVVSTPSSP